MKKAVQTKPQELQDFCSKYSITPESFAAFAANTMREAIESGNVRFEDLGVSVVSVAKLEEEAPAVDVDSSEFLEVLALNDQHEEKTITIKNPIPMHVSNWGYLILAAKAMKTTRESVLGYAMWLGTVALHEYGNNTETAGEFLHSDIRAGIAARKAGKAVAK